MAKKKSAVVTKKTKEEELEERMAAARVAEEMRKADAIKKQIKHLEKVKANLVDSKRQREKAFQNGIKFYDDGIATLKKELAKTEKNAKGKP